MGDVSTAKTQVDIREVEGFVYKQIDDTVRDIKPLTGGEKAIAFELISPNGSQVIKFGPIEQSFSKERIAFDRFTNDQIPIPEVIRIGQFNSQLHYALVEKAVGTCNNPRPELYPSMMKTLAAIHEQSLPEGTKFGWWGEGFEPRENSWGEYTEKSLIKLNIIGNCYQEQKVLDEAKILALAAAHYAPPRPHVLHGDFGYDNLFDIDGTVSNVIDWENSLYGDPLRELGNLTFWERFRADLKVDFLELYLPHVRDESNLGNHFEERIVGYQCHSGLAAFSFYRNSNQVSNAHKVMSTLNQIVPLD